MESIPTRSEIQQRVDRYKFAADTVEEHYSRALSAADYVHTLSQKDELKYSDMSLAMETQLIWLYMEAEKQNLQSNLKLPASGSFRSGFILGLEVDRLLTGDDFDQTLVSTFHSRLDQHIRNSGIDALQAEYFISSVGKTTYRHNMGYMSEPSAVEYNKITNPLSQVIASIGSELYENAPYDIEEQFHIGYGIARDAQVYYQAHHQK